MRWRFTSEGFRSVFSAYCRPVCMAQVSAGGAEWKLGCMAEPMRVGLCSDTHDSYLLFVASQMLRKLSPARLPFFKRSPTVSKSVRGSRPVWVQYGAIPKGQSLAMICMCQTLYDTALVIARRSDNSREP